MSVDDHPDWADTAQVLTHIRNAMARPRIPDTYNRDDQLPSSGPRDAFYILLPLLIVLSTFLFLLLLFLICVILLRRRRGIMLRDHDGPVDMSREDLIEGEGGFDGVESRWLESVNEPTRRSYLRAQGTVSPYFCAKPSQQSFKIRISTSVSSKLHAHRYHSISVPLHPRKGRIRLVFRTRF